MNKQLVWIIVILILIALCGAFLFVLTKRQPGANTVGNLPSGVPTEELATSTTANGAEVTANGGEVLSTDGAARKAQIQPLVDEFVKTRQDRLDKESAHRTFNDDELSFLSNQQAYALEALVKQGKLNEADKQLFK